jgi:hypothetical protein
MFSNAPNAANASNAANAANVANAANAAQTHVCGGWLSINKRLLTDLLELVGVFLIRHLLMYYVYDCVRAQC